MGSRIRQVICLHGPVMIVSYETLRTLQDELVNCPIGLLLADEGHRLKNAGMACRCLISNQADLPQTL